MITQTLVWMGKWAHSHKMGKMQTNHFGEHFGKFYQKFIFTSTMDTLEWKISVLPHKTLDYIGLFVLINFILLIILRFSI